LKGTSTGHLFEDCVRKLNIFEVLELNSTLRKLIAVQKRHLESLAEGPYYYSPGERLWRFGATVDKAFIIVAGTVSFIPKRRNADTCAGRVDEFNLNVEDDYSNGMRASSLGDTMRQNAAKVRDLLDDDDDSSSCSSSSISTNISEDRIRDLDIDSTGTDSLADNHEYAKLSSRLEKRADQSMGLEKRADQLFGLGNSKLLKSDESSTDVSHDGYSTTDYSIQSDDLYGDTDHSIESIVEARRTRRDSLRRRSSRERFANKQLERLYNRRAFTAGLVFSRGHFLGDISKMVAGKLLSSTYDGDESHFDGDDDSAHYGFGEKPEGDHQGPVREMIIHEQEGDQHIAHSSTLASGKDGCVVLVFSKVNLIPLLDEYPGLLLSLLGTQVKM